MAKAIGRRRRWNRVLVKLFVHGKVQQPRRPKSSSWTGRWTTKQANHQTTDTVGPLFCVAIKCFVSTLPLKRGSALFYKRIQRTSSTPTWLYCAVLMNSMQLFNCANFVGNCCCRQILYWVVGKLFSLKRSSTQLQCTSTLHTRIIGTN